MTLSFYVSQRLQISSFIKLWENEFLPTHTHTHTHTHPERRVYLLFDLLNLKIFHQIAQENPGGQKYTTCPIL
jgi:hypothetical protein